MIEVDNIEPYGRRSLLRVSGIPESAAENIDFIVRSLFTEINPDFNDLDVERTHRNGLLSPPNSNTPTDDAAGSSETSAEFITSETEQMYDKNNTIF